MVIYWVIYALVCIGHLGTCFKEKELLRKISKVFVIPTLMLSLLLTKTFNALLVVGLLLGWIGDVMLVFTGKKKLFIVGAISFLLGHISYIIAALALFIEKYGVNNVPIWIFVLLTLVAICFFLLTKFKIRKHFGVASYFGAFYFYILLIAILTSFLTKAYILTFGFALFIISDTLVSISRFARPIKKQHFYIMTTYILAQTLICLSFIYGT